ncbi:MAG: tetratricopeptide repeat protein [Bacteroidales bacterium]|nr:tetratricopeptide repeat protein [Bacteroidales bacterium]
MIIIKKNQLPITFFFLFILGFYGECALPHESSIQDSIHQSLDERINEVASNQTVNINTTISQLWTLESECNDQRYKRGKMFCYSNIAKKYFSLRNNDSAMICTHQALDVAIELSDQKYITKYKLNLGKIYSRDRKFEAAYPYLKDALDFASNDTSMYELWLDAIEGMGAYYMQRNLPDSSIYYYSIGLESTDTGSVSQGSILHNMAILYRLKGDFHKAKSYYQQALRNFRVHQMQKNIAISLNNIGVMHATTGAKDSALICFYEAIKINKQLGKMYGVANALNNTANINIQLENYTQAIQDLKQAREITNDKQMLDAEMNILLSMFTAYYRSDSILICKTIIQQADSLAVIHGINEKMALIKYRKGQVYDYFNQKDSALVCYLQAEEFLNVNQDETVLGPLLCELGVFYLEHNEEPKAEEYFQQAVEILEGNNDVIFLKNATKGLWEVYKQKEAHGKAHEYARKYISLLDSTYQIESDKHAQELIAKYESEKKEAKILLQGIELKNERAKLRILGVGISLLLFLLIIILFINKKKEAAYKKLVEKNLELANIPKMKVRQKINSVTEKQDKIYEDLIKGLERDKVFLQNDLTLDSLAKQINTNRTELSEVISIFEKKNFPSYIGEYRIQHAINLLKNEEQKYSIEAIAFESGFKSTSNFYKLFKESTGLTPSSFLKVNKN